MAFEGVKSGLKVTEIPQGNGFIGRARCDDGLRGGIEGNGVDGVTMLALCRCGGASRVGLSGVEDLQGDVVGHRSDQGFMKRVVLDIVDDRGMVSESARGFKGLVAFGVCSQIPNKVSGM